MELSVTDKNIIGAITEYDEILLGNRKKLSNYYYQGDKYRDSDTALAVVSYCIKNILQWTPEQVEENLTNSVILNYKLDLYIKHIIFEYEPHKNARLCGQVFTRSSIRYLIHLVFPDEYHYNLKSATIDLYESVLYGEIAKFPKNYFEDSTYGRTRACICLQYAINNLSSFNSIENLYKSFVSPSINAKLKKDKLELACKVLYKTPLDFLHDALPRNMKDEALYQAYKSET